MVRVSIVPKSVFHADLERDKIAQTALLLQNNFKVDLETEINNTNIVNFFIIIILCILLYVVIYDFFFLNINCFFILFVISVCMVFDNFC